VRLQQLHLTGFRNYRRLALNLPSGNAIFCGENGQGKSNLLEAVYLLATSRSFRTRADRELLNWSQTEAGAPTGAFARVAALVERAGNGVRLDIVIAAAAEPERKDAVNGLATRKQIMVNGVKRQPAELVGQLMVTLFTPADIDLVLGPPDLRRRYLDLTLSQTDRAYFRALATYQRVLAQRNSLLRSLREGHGRVEQLNFWNDELLRSGVYVLDQRASAVARLSALLAPNYVALSGDAAAVGLRYLSSVPEPMPGSHSQTTAERYAATLQATRSREVAAGMSLVGPHRDDLAFMLDGRPLAAAGSRGQIRLATVALKLAEVALMRELTGETPVLLLDDVLSELDRRRRALLVAALASDQQVLITATDLDAFAPDFLVRCRRYRVDAGTVSED
jgi:DNA replication and repair protein RecF